MRNIPDKNQSQLRSGEHYPSGPSLAINIPYSSERLYNPQRLKTYLRTCAPSEIRITLHIRTICLEYLLGAYWAAKNANFLHMNKKKIIIRLRGCGGVLVVRSSEGTFSQVVAAMSLFRFSDLSSSFESWFSVCVIRTLFFFMPRFIF